MFGGFNFNNIGEFIQQTVESTLNDPSVQAHIASAGGSSVKNPPASRGFLSSLPMVKVTADDLLEVTNKECLICLEEQQLGAYACKLPCGHLFHKECVVGWLEKNCTCPVCRFELETDDANFEMDRKKRMKKRKLRFRIDEIKGKTIGQLREICRSLSINTRGCIDKNELIECMVQSGLIDITEGTPPMEFTKEEFNNKSVSELRHLLLSFGISDQSLLEKSEFRNKLIESGRVIISPDTTCSSNNSDSYNNNYNHSYRNDTSNNINYNVKEDLHEKSDNDNYDNNKNENNFLSNTSYDNNTNNNNKNSNLNNASCTSTNPNDSNNINNGSDNRKNNNNNELESKFTLSSLKDMKLSSLREICRNHKIGIRDCLDKNDVIQKIANCTTVVVDDDNDQNNSNVYDSYDNYSNNNSHNIYKSDVDNNDNNNMDNKSNYECVKMNDNNVNKEDEIKINKNNDSNNNNSNNNSNNNNTNSNNNSNNNNNSQEKFVLSLSLLEELSVRELKDIMHAYSISPEGCLYRSDIISRMKTCPQIQLID